MWGARLKHQLKAARQRWRNEVQNSAIEGSPVFLQGVVWGFNETLRIVTQFQKEEHRRITEDRKLSPRAGAALFYRACVQAYGRLKQSDRIGAMRILKRAIDRRATA